MKTVRSEHHVTDKQLIGFGINDRLGREIGASIISFEDTFTQIPDDSRSWYTMAPGTYFGATCMATRNGRLYGASQRDRHFKTAAEREEAIAKYLTDARKRASKK